MLHFCCGVPFVALDFTLKYTTYITMKLRNTYYGMSAVALLLLGACGKGGSNVRDIFGLDRSSPDEFSVVSRPPLTVPKEFYLTPPGVEVEKPESARADVQAKKLLEAEMTLPEVPVFESSVRGVDASEVLGVSGSSALSLSIPEPVDITKEMAAPVASISSDDVASSAEEALLGRVGANQADPEIRSKLKQEAWETQKAAEKESVWDALRGETVTSEEPVVDAQEEAERIVSNKEEGKAINEGDVKLDDPAEQTPLQRIMSWF